MTKREMIRDRKMRTKVQTKLQGVASLRTTSKGKDSRLLIVQGDRSMCQRFWIGGGTPDADGPIETPSGQKRIPGSKSQGPNC